jgi:RND family efflux transporter MFP subunit
LQASTIEQARAQEQAALAQADQERVQIAKASIYSPIDGVVVNRNLNQGEYPGNRQIFTLQQVDPIYAILRGSGNQIAKIVAGARANVTASDLQNAKLTGSVVGVLNQIQPGSTDFQVKVVLANPSGRLRPGMAVVGNIALPPVTGVRVPATAFTDDNHTQVMAVTSDGVVRTVKVREIADDGATAVVTGVRSGTRIVTDGQTSVGDGQKVAIR